jgi:hypothetical protein
MEKLLHSLYYDIKNPTAFSSARPLFLAAKQVDKTVTLRKVQRWLDEQRTYALYKVPRRKFQRTKTRWGSLMSDFQVSE